MPDCASIHFTAFMGASCWATWVAWPVTMSYILPALSAPPEKTLFPSCWRRQLRVLLLSAERTLFQHVLRIGPWCWYMALPCVWPPVPTSYMRTCPWMLEHPSTRRYVNSIHYCPNFQQLNSRLQEKTRAKRWNRWAVRGPRHPSQRQLMLRWWLLALALLRKTTFSS